jgi:hypothetical protein
MLSFRQFGNTVSLVMSVLFGCVTLRGEHGLWVFMRMCGSKTGDFMEGWKKYTEELQDIYC